MGKALIIHGADFSQNAIERGQWLYPKGLNYNPNKTFSTGTWSTTRLLSNLEGKTISRFKILNPAVSGAVYIFKAKATIGQPLTGINMVESFNVTAGLTEEFQFTAPIVLAQGETLAIRAANGIVRYMQPSSDYSTEYSFSDQSYGGGEDSVEYGVDFFGV